LPCQCLGQSSAWILSDIFTNCSITLQKLANCLLALLFLGLGVPSLAAPYKPQRDAEVLEVLPARAADPRMRELRRLRNALAARPTDLPTAVQLARAYYGEVAAEGDPRYIGYAQAALAPWWDQPAPPLPVRVVRAMLLQFSHQFDAALADVQAATQQDPDQGEAWAWQTAIHMVQANYGEAQRTCVEMARLATKLIGAGCKAQIDSLTGHAAAAATALHEALARNPRATAAEQLWVLTRLGEIEERRGQFALAEDAFRRALKLDITDGYLLAAYADFLLDQARPAEVLTLLKGRERSDLLLLRLALAAKAMNSPALAAWSAELSARFDAARLRGDTVHQKEEARYVLALLGPSQTARALDLARRNYAVQREPADARVLLEAALAAGQPDAAAPVLAWMKSSGVESQGLQALARSLKAGS
jgi:tetratricopeptide (TPR) repeat protein